MWIPRDYSEFIIQASKTKPAILLTGVRQVGKSSLLKKLFIDAEYVTLDKSHLAEEAEHNPESFLGRFKGQVIIDEIQYAPSLFRELKIQIDNNRQQKGKWILTGSQQFSLMQHISESLAGRIRILNLGTLSAHELLQANAIKTKRDLLWQGGFPEIWAENIAPSDFFEDYIQTYLERDLKLILNVSSLRDFRRFLTLLAIRTGQLIKYSEIAKEVGVAVNTIKSWVNALEVSGIIILLPPYYNNLGKRLIKTPKLYFCDTGLASSLLNISSAESLNNSPFLGNIWENFVLTEFLKNKLAPGKDLFFYRDQNGVEIDFIIDRADIQYLIEAKHTEKPNNSKLNFSKVAPLFKSQTVCIVACNINDTRPTKLKDYTAYNPLNGIQIPNDL